MNRLLIALVAVTAVARASTTADTGFLDRTVSIGGQQYRYQVFVPLDWSATQKWPLIINLHGNGSQGSDGLSHTKQSSLITEIRADRSRFPAIVLWPQAREGTRWSTPAMQEMVLAQLERTMAEFSGDPNRIYLTGFSMGGGGAIRIASKWPDRFAAVVDMAGRVSGNAVGRDKALIEEDIRAHAYLQSSDVFAGAARLIRNLPIWVFHGDVDETVTVEESRRLVAALRSVRADVRYTELKGADHGQTPAKAWADKSLIEWLLAQRRSGTRNEREVAVAPPNRALEPTARD